MPNLRVKVVNVFPEYNWYLVEVVLQCFKCNRRTSGLIKVGLKGAVRSVGCGKCRRTEPVKLEW